MVQTTLPFGLFTPKRSSNVRNKSNGETASKSGTDAIKNKADSDLDFKSKNKQLKLRSPSKSSPKSLILGSQVKSEKEMAINKRKFNDYDDDDDDDIEIIELKFNDIQGVHNDQSNNFGQLSTPSSLKRQKRNTSPIPMKIINKVPQNTVKSKKKEEEEDEEDDSNMYDSDSSLSSVGI
ncbi:unnamed protein product [[Candida] boidinii]|nr:unnamed protein product [[Candida] boidinii]